MKVTKESGRRRVRFGNDSERWFCGVCISATELETDLYFCTNHCLRDFGNRLLFNLYDAGQDHFSRAGKTAL